MNCILRIYKNINVCIIGRRRHVLAYKSSKKPKSQAAPVQSEQNRTVNFKLNYLKQLCQSCFCHFNKSEEEIDYKYSPKYK